MAKATTIKCSGCKKTFKADEHYESIDFNQHQCPSLLPIESGESFDDWCARCDAASN